MGTMETPDGDEGRSAPRRRTEIEEEPFRRLQRMGAVTIGVSLPKRWVARHRLGVGSPITMRALADDSILLRAEVPQLDGWGAIVPVNRSSSPEHLFRDLVGAYISGAHGFEILEDGGLRPETRQIVRTFARRTFQIEIVSEDPDRLVLRDVSRGGDLDLGAVLNRMFQVVLDLQRQAAAAWKRAEPTEEVPLGVRDDEVDRYGWLVERVLTLRLAPETLGEYPKSVGDHPLYYLLLSRYLERVADHAVKIADVHERLAGVRLPARFTSALADLHGQILRALEAAVDVAEHPDSARANEVIDTTEALHQTQETLREGLLARARPADLTPAAAAGLGFVLESLDRTVAYAQDIAEIGLDRAARGGLVPVRPFVAPRPLPPPTARPSAPRGTASSPNGAPPPPPPSARARGSPTGSSRRRG